MAGSLLSENDFSAEVSLSGQFDREAIFLDNRFGGIVDFKLAHFNAPTILRGNRFEHRPIIDEIRLSYVPIMPDDQVGAGPPLIFGYLAFLKRLKQVSAYLAESLARTLSVAKTDDAYATLRQFRVFAQEHDDRRLALDIYALEQKSRRLWLDGPLSKSFVLGLVFQIVADFGRSMLRPLLGLGAVFAVFGLTFVLMGRVTACPSANRWKSGLLLSLNNTFPFLSWQKQSILASADACLFGSEGPTLAFAVSSVVQMCLALMSFFLLGLAVRNTFKMQT